MKVECNIIIDVENKKKVENILKSIKVDDFDFIKSKITGNKLEASIKSSSISSLLHSLDDYLSCISVALKVIEKNEEK